MWKKLPNIFRVTSNWTALFFTSKAPPFKVDGISGRDIQNFFIFLKPSSSLAFKL